MTTYKQLFHSALGSLYMQAANAALSGNEKEANRLRDECYRLEMFAAAIEDKESTGETKPAAQVVRTAGFSAAERFYGIAAD